MPSPGSCWRSRSATPIPKGTAVFVHECTACRKRQLIFPTQFVRVDGEQGRPVATFECWCGAEQRAAVGWTPSPKSDVTLAA